MWHSTMMKQISENKADATPFCVIKQQRTFYQNL